MKFVNSEIGKATRPIVNRQILQHMYAGWDVMNLHFLYSKKKYEPFLPVLHYINKVVLSF